MPRMGPLSPSDPNIPGPLPPTLLQKLEPSTVWHDQVEALQQLADLTIPLSKQANVDAIMRQLRPHGHNLAEVIQNPRSVLVKEACMCIETLAETFGPNFVAAVGIEVIPALLKRCSITKAIIRDSAREAAKAMFEHGVEGVHLSTARLISQTVLDKQSPNLTRAAAAEFIGLMLVERCRDGLSDIHELVRNAIIEGCGDPDGTVREISRDNCSRLLNLDPALWEQVFRELPTHAKQYIAKPRDRIGTADESVLPRRASMVPQRARPRPESFHTGMSVGLRGRYAPARVQRASVNPVDLGSQPFFKDNMPPRVPNLPRPSRLDPDFRANLPRKPFRAVRKPPRRSIAPFIRQNDINFGPVRDEPAATRTATSAETSPSFQGNPSAQGRVLPNSLRSPEGEKVPPKDRQLSENESPDRLQLVGNATKGSVAGEDTEDAGKRSHSLASPANSGTKSPCSESGLEVSQREAEAPSMGPCLSAVTGKSRCSKAHATETAEEAEQSPIPSLTIRSPTETTPVCGSFSPSQESLVENEGTEGTGVSMSSRESTPFREGQEDCSNRLTESPVLKKDVNKGRLSFIMGVNQTPRVDRTMAIVRPDMSISKLMDSPATPGNEHPRSETEEENVDKALTFDSKVDEQNCGASASPSKLENDMVASDEESLHEESISQTKEPSATETGTPNAATSMVSESGNHGEVTPSRATTDENELTERGVQSEVENATPSEGSSKPESLECEAVQDDGVNEAQGCHGRSNSTEQLLKSLQGMPDIPAFEKLMEDFEKQTLCNVAPGMSFTHKAEEMNKTPGDDGLAIERDGNDKENTEDDSTRKERRVQLKLPQASRKDAADMKPPQKSRAASFKGRPPRRSLMPQTVATGTGGMAASSARVESDEMKVGKKDVKKLKTNTRRVEADTRKKLVKKTCDSNVGRGTGRGKVAEKTRSGAVGKTVRGGWTSGVGTTRASVLRARENTGTTRTQTGGAVKVVEKRKKSVLPAKMQEVVDALRACNRAKKEGWQAKWQSLKRFEEGLRAVADEKMPARLAEDCVYMLGEYIVDGHHKVVVGALEGFFYLFLCSVGGAQARALQKGLERKNDSLRRILQLTRDCKEDTRLASERVLDGFGVQFEPETQVGLIMQAMTSDRGRSKMVDGRVATSGCGLLVRAFERADRNEGGFVWKTGVLEVIVSVVGRLSKDRRVEVRRAAGPVVTAVKQCLPERAFEMACRKVGVHVRG